MTIPPPGASAARRPDPLAPRMARRSFLKTAAAVGLATPLVGPLLGGCGSDAPGNHLVVAAPTTPPSLDWELVFGKEVYDHIFNLNDRLTRWKQIPAPDEEGGFDLAWQASNLEEITEARMAEGWEVTNGGTTYTFSLRKGWPSHAGNEFTAEDVKWTFDRSFALQGLTSFFNAIATIRGPGDVRVVDKYTVRIDLAEPGPDLLLTMSTFWRAIVDSAAAKSHATASDPWAKEWLKNNDAGFGPYKLAELTPGRRVVWVAHEEHPFRPMLDQITFTEVPESSDRLAMLLSGEAHAAQYLAPADMQQIENRDDVRLWNYQGYVIATVIMNPTFAPLQDTRVRQALSFATPYDQILDQVYLGFAGPAHGPLSDHAAGFDPYLTPYTYDPDQARRLLQESGLANGFTTRFAYSTAEPLGAPVGTQLQRAFADVGVTLELEALPPPAFTEGLFAGQRPMFFQTFGGDSPDPAYALSVFYQSESSNNWGRYSSAETDACLAEAGRPELQWDERVGHHARCAEVIANDAPWLWIAQPGFQVSTRRDVTGINWYAGEGVDWSKVTFRN